MFKSVTQTRQLDPGKNDFTRRQTYTFQHCTGVIFFYCQQMGGGFSSFRDAAKASNQRHIARLLLSHRCFFDRSTDVVAGVVFPFTSKTGYSLQEWRKSIIGSSIIQAFKRHRKGSLGDGRHARRTKLANFYFFYLQQCGVSKHLLFVFLIHI